MFLNDKASKEAASIVTVEIWDHDSNFIARLNIVVLVGQSKYEIHEKENI